jgi:transforming growth factor-beta-induced protein
LVGALSADGPFTVFAPTNEAFNALFKQLGVSGVKDLTAEQLTPILTYHVVSGKVMSTDLSNTSVATLNGQKIKIDISNGVKINDSHVTKADISGTNGVVHVIDKVLIPN